MKQEKREYDGKRNRMKILTLTGIIFLAAVLLWGYYLFRLKYVTFEGLTRYSENEFTDQLQDSFFMTCTPLFCLKHSVSKTEIPFIESYEVEYADRNSVRIVVYEKRVTGCIPLMGGYLYFDKDGIVVESSNRKIEGIPLVEGLEFDEIILYQKLQIQKQSLFTTILELTRLMEKNAIEVEKISFSSDYQVTLYCGTVEVLLGKRDSYDEQMNALKGILTAADGRSGILDMRNYSKENKEVILK